MKFKVLSTCEGRSTLMSTCEERSTTGEGRSTGGQRRSTDDRSGVDGGNSRLVGSFENGHQLGEIIFKLR